MERNAAQGGLTGRTYVAGSLAFAVAQREDEPDIRRLLRENPLDGWVRLSLEREPDAFATDFGLSRSHAFIVARDRATGEAAGICERSVREAFVDGEVRRLPYLGSLRVTPRYRHRIRLLRGGFEAVRTLLHKTSDLPYALTSITADNEQAARVLCAGLPGLPAYRPAGELATFAIRTRALALPRGVDQATADDIPAIAVLLQRNYRRFQFAPVWSACELRQLIAAGGLRSEDFLVVRRGPGVRGSLAVWDQSAAKQTVVRGYSPWLRRLRPLVNLAAPLTGMPRLPPPGYPLAQAYLSHVAVEDDDPAVFRSLLAAGSALARRRGFDIALTGFATGHPFAAIVHARRAAVYRSLLHLVHWPNAAAVTSSARLPHVEIAVL
ncbi:MAG TPA: hypothetical protein VKD43_07755 [Xanthobacteraceae bacterium]|nr:hypothetical protein [Xanthobacteraceae bacterium]